MPELPTLSVAECVRQLNAIFVNQVVAVEGEIQGFRISQDRWGFFTLKDPKADSVIECFIMAFRVRIPIEDGMTVRVVATPGIHAKSGRFRLTVEYIEIVGEGALRRAFEILKAKLQAEGLFSTARKRVVSRFPMRIGLIASRESAAYSDFLKVLKARFGGLTILTCHVTVQGVSATASIIEAIHDLGTLTPPLDALVITRGGGSLEDLMPFNDEELAREAFRSPVPIISAVGHERDVTILDLVADVRASTPSNAAELIVPHRRETWHEVQALADRLQGGMEHRLILAAHDVDRRAHFFATILERQRRTVHVVVQRFSGIFSLLLAIQATSTSKLDATATDLNNALARKFSKIKKMLSERQRQLASLNPERLLTRGYSIVRHRGRVVQSIRQLAVGDDIDVKLADGLAGANITRT